MDNTIFRKKSLDRISSPEALDDYLRVTTPAFRLILAAAIILLAGTLIWGHVASSDSFAAGRARVENGQMYIKFDNEQVAQNAQRGMIVTAGETQSRITSIGTDNQGQVVAVAPTDLADGFYTVDVTFSRTQLIRLLFK